LENKIFLLLIKNSLMPQAILPMFSSDMTIVNTYIAFQEKDDTVYWFHGSFPVFRHHKHNEEAFRLFCCQLINLGSASSAELSRALGVNREKLSRWARQERSPSSGVSSTVGRNKKKQKQATF
jgi:hypothetical protein